MALRAGWPLTAMAQSTCLCNFFSESCVMKKSSPTKNLRRCSWPGEEDPLMIAYHDREWGKPVRDDRKLFEFLVLEAFQAGLSWSIILHKRENFRKAFKQFDYRKVARFTVKDRARLVKDAGIVRNRLKIAAPIK